MRPSNRDGFKIAIICTLNLEAEAAEEALDKTYDRLSMFTRNYPEMTTHMSREGLGSVMLFYATCQVLKKRVLQACGKHES